MKRSLIVVMAAATLLSAGCGSSAPEPTQRPSHSASAAPSASAASPSQGAGPPVRVSGTLATGLNVPWGAALLPDGSLLVTSRDTRRISRVPAHGGRPSVEGTVSAAVSNGAQGGEGGLLGLALSPSYARDHLLYVYYSTASDNRIARIAYTPSAAAGRRLGAPHPILTGIPHGVHHNGGRIAFGPDGMLYAGTGEAGDKPLAQDRSSLGGKILRMTPDGRPAPGNPFPHSVVYSYGHRNVQGLAWDPQGRLWASELGDRKADELNLIRPGRNYGWPATQGRTDHPGYTSPVAQFGTETDSPSGLAWSHGALWMAALKGERLWRIPMDGARTAGSPHAYLIGADGRLRTVLPDGSGLLLTTSNTDHRGSPRPGDDRILRLTVR